MLIAFEGIDGSGKQTQSKLYCEYLEKIKKDFLYVDFPNYGKSFFAKEISKYLNHEYGDINQNHPKLISLLYAGDRFEQKEIIEQAIKDKKIIISNRYTPSNIAHQSAKIDISERKELKIWLEELEFDVFKIPKYDVVVFLDIPFNHSDKLVEKKNKRQYTDKIKDIHEENKSYMQKVYDTYKVLALDTKWITISCIDDNDNLKSKEIITQEIISSLESFV